MKNSEVVLSKADFWRYSYITYAIDDVAPASLTLQDKFGVNVNLIMLLCWCLQEGVILTLSQCQQLIECVETSEQELKAHRRERQSAKPKEGELSARYDNLKAEELELEKAQQALILAQFNQFDVSYLPKEAAVGGNVFNASIAAFINAYALREAPQARLLLSAIIKALP